MNLICKILGHREGDLKLDTECTSRLTGRIYSLHYCKRCKCTFKIKQGTINK